MCHDTVSNLADRSSGLHLDTVCQNWMNEGAWPKWSRFIFEYMTNAIVKALQSILQTDAMNVATQFLTLLVLLFAFKFG